MRRVYITQEQIEKAREDWPVEWGPIGKEVYERSYARTKPDGSKEDWFETVARVVNGNLNYVREDYIEKSEPQKLFESICKMQCIPGGRHLWASGIADGVSRQYISNCFSADFTSTFSEHFEYTFMRLMEGGGVGANYSNFFINSNQGKPWKPKCKIDLHLLCNEEHRDYNSDIETGEYTPVEKDGVTTYIKGTKPFKDFLSTTYSIEGVDLTERDSTFYYLKVEDSREGWCEALVQLLQLSMLEEKSVKFLCDVSIVRPFGADLRGFGGKASGPGALMYLLQRVAGILNNANGNTLTSLDMMLIDQYIAEAVVAGGTRRSARGAWKYWGDPDIFEFIKCKESGTDHWTTNISVVIDNKFFRALKKGTEHAKAVYNAVLKGMLTNGEPGFINASYQLEGEAPDAVFYGTNPCGEITMVRYPDMNCFDVCCLGHVNLANEDVTDETWRLMTRFLIRATFAPAADPRVKKSIERNRRIGVGFFGYHNWLVYQGIRYSDAPKKESVRKYLKKVKNLVDDEAREYSKQLRIPEPIKKTTLAPTGTISNLTGDSSGCQAIFSKRYIRRVRYNTSKDAKLLEDLRSEGKVNIVTDNAAANTSIAEFFFVDPIYDRARTKLEEQDIIPEMVDDQLEYTIEDSDEIALKDALENQCMLQELYVDNSISITFGVNPGEYTVDKLGALLIHYLPGVKGLTLWPYKTRALSPLEKLSKEDFEALVNKGYQAESGQAEQACSKAGCPIK